MDEKDDWKVWGLSPQQEAVQFWAQVVGVTIGMRPVTPSTPLGRLEQLTWYVDQLGLTSAQVEELHPWVARYVGAVRRAALEPENY